MGQFRNSRRWIYFCCLLGVGIFPASSALAMGRLSGVASAAAEGGSEAPPRKKQRSSSSGSSSCDNGDSFGSLGAELFAQLFLIGVTSPWWVPFSVVEHEHHPTAEFRSEPYVDGSDGLLTLEILPDLSTKSWQVRLLTDYGTDFNNLQRVGGQLQYDTTSRFGFETSWNNFTEDLGDTTDSLWLGDANLTFRFAQNESVLFHTGLGFNWLSHEQQSDFGFNFMYGFELYPQKPWIVRGLLDLGRIGETSRVHFRGDVGFAWKKMEFLVGYDLERLSNINLQGFSAGMQVRF